MITQQAGESPIPEVNGGRGGKTGHLSHDKLTKTQQITVINFQH
jgi:hypothetical protein